MAIHQVVEQNGQKVLVEVPVGSNELWGKYVEGVVPENPSSLIANMPVGAYVTDDTPTAPTTIPAPYNKEVWITESGTFTVPVTGWYEVLLINGGRGGCVDATANIIYVYGGTAGYRKTFLSFLEQGQTVPVTVGAGGLGVINSVTGGPGGATSFNGVSIDASKDYKDTDVFTDTGSMCQTSRSLAWVVEGKGGGGISIGYGAGGSASASHDYTNPQAVNGKQGAIRLRYYDSNKEQD